MLMQCALHIARRNRLSLPSSSFYCQNLLFLCRVNAPHTLRPKYSTCEPSDYPRRDGPALVMVTNSIHSTPLPYLSLLASSATANDRADASLVLGDLYGWGSE